MSRQSDTGLNAAVVCSMTTLNQVNSAIAVELTAFAYCDYVNMTNKELACTPAMGVFPFTCRLAVP